MAKESSESNEPISPFAGLGILEEGQALAEQIENRSWVRPSLDSLGPSAGTGAFASNPIETLSSLGASWLLDHLSPLKDWLDQLASDPTQTENFAQAWNSAAESLQNNANDLLHSVQSDVSPLEGTTVSTYRDLQNDVAMHVELAGTCSHAMSTGLNIASTLIVTVHNTVSDAIGEIVSSVADHSGEFAVSLQSATPKIITHVSSLSLEWASKMRQNLDDLLSSTQELANLTKDAEGIFKRLESAMSSVNGGHSSDSSSPASARRVNSTGSTVQETSHMDDTKNDHASLKGESGLGGLKSGSEQLRGDVADMGRDSSPDREETPRNELYTDEDEGRPFIPKGKQGN